MKFFLATMLWRGVNQKISMPGPVSLSKMYKSWPKVPKFANLEKVILILGWDTPARNSRRAAPVPTYPAKPCLGKKCRAFVRTSTIAPSRVGLYSPAYLEEPDFVVVVVTERCQERRVHRESVDVAHHDLESAGTRFSSLLLAYY